MSQVGSEANPLRVAIVGAGPAGFYAAERLFKEKGLTVQVDMFERLPVPFGLVRFGVAPDHPKIKSVTKVFDRIAKKPGFRFFGNVDVGEDISVEDLKQYYHQIIFTIGAPTDRNLPVPGVEFAGNYPATEFVAWYNGHPDYRDYEFDLSKERVAVVGIGNVAVDVARILVRDPDELAETDIADYALAALRESKVKEVYVLGRRGPAQAAFTPPEAKELLELNGVDTVVLPEEAELDPLSQESMAASGRGVVRNVEIIQQMAENEPTDQPHGLTIRFLISPVEIFGNDAGEVVGMKLVKNELYKTESGTLRPRATDQFEEIPIDLVFRSVGYRGVPVPGVSFNDRWGVIMNQEGRIVDAETGEQVIGEYTAGWIKRGPSGVIGTNKPDAVETVVHMLEDLQQDKILHPAHPQAEAAELFIAENQPRFVTYDDWLLIDEIEVAKGQEQGRPRVKFTSVEEMLEVVGK